MIKPHGPSPRLLRYGLLLITALQPLLLGAVPAQSAAAPAAAYISGVVGHAQSYNLSCESRSAVDLAAYWGVSIAERTFFDALPKSDNPNVGFVGNVNGTWGQVPPNPYGVHAKPVAKTLRTFGLDAAHRYGMTFGQLKQEIAAGRPVIVWVIGGVWSGETLTYTAKNGDSMPVAAYEHTMIAIGYDDSFIYLIDAGNGVTQTHKISNFKASWAVLGNQAVVADRAESAGSGNPNSGNAGVNNNAGGNQPAPNKPANNKNGSYVVKSGDYLRKIAEQHGLAWTELAAANGISYPYIIHVGQTLSIPGGGSASNNGSAPTAKPNKDNNNQSGGNKNPASYTVQRGDYLIALAREFGVNWQTLASANNISYPWVVYPGQVLKIP